MAHGAGIPSDDRTPPWINAVVSQAPGRFLMPDPQNRSILKSETVAGQAPESSEKSTPNHSEIHTSGQRKSREDRRVVRLGKLPVGAEGPGFVGQRLIVNLRTGEEASKAAKRGRHRAFRRAPDGAASSGRTRARCSRRESSAGARKADCRSLRPDRGWHTRKPRRPPR